MMEPTATRKFTQDEAELLVRLARLNPAGRWPEFAELVAAIQEAHPLVDKRIQRDKEAQRILDHAAAQNELAVFVGSEEGRVLYARGQRHHLRRRGVPVDDDLWARALFVGLRELQQEVAQARGELARMDSEIAELERQAGGG